MIIDEKLLNQVSDKAKVNERLRMNYNFHETLDDKTQRMLNALEPGTILPIHRHRYTAETYLLLRGKIRVFFYNELGCKQKIFCLDTTNGNYGVHIPKGQWHTLEVLESNTVIFEVKDGPYRPVDPEDMMD